jgi:hypothetical protein
MSLSYVRFVSIHNTQVARVRVLYPMKSILSIQTWPAVANGRQPYRHGRRHAMNEVKKYSAVEEAKEHCRKAWQELRERFRRLYYTALGHYFSVVN